MRGVIAPLQQLSIPNAGPANEAMALRWILDFKTVSTIIPGASRIEQVGANAAVSNLPSLPIELHEKLKSFYNEKVVFNVRGPY